MFAPAQRTSAKLFLMMVMAIFIIAYLIRYLYLDYYSDTATYLTDVNPEWNVVTADGLDDAFAISTLLFGLFVALSPSPLSQSMKPIQRVGYIVPPVFMGLALLAIVAITLAFRAAYGSALGEQPADIPFGLGTPIYRAQADLFPGLLLLFAEAAWFGRNRKHYWFWIAALGAFNLSMSMLTTSKAGLIFFAVQFVMLMYLTDQNIWAKPLRIFSLGLAALVAFIYAAQLRSQALLGTDALILVSLREGYIFATLLEVAGLIGNRLPGVEGLALYCGYGCEGLPTITFPALNGAAGQIFTQEVIRVRGDFDFRSPGYIGGAIIVAGTWGGSVLAISFLRGVLGGMRIMDRQGFSAATKIVVCFGMFRFLLEGVWAWQDLASMTVAAVIVEICARRVLRQRDATNDSGLPNRFDGYLAGTPAR